MRGREGERENRLRGRIMRGKYIEIRMTVGEKGRGCERREGWMRGKRIRIKGNRKKYEGKNGCEGWREREREGMREEKREGEEIT